MKFLRLDLNDEGEVSAEAMGHATEVLARFLDVAGILLSPMGPWRLTYAHGIAPLEMKLDTDMLWTLTAQTKVVAPIS